MEFIQRKSVDQSVENYLTKAADAGISLAWDRLEGQLPECGFCETGLSCRDCLQGPCISHPFRDGAKRGVCGKNKDDLATQSFLRLVLKGTIAYLHQAGEFSRDLAPGNIVPNDQAQAKNAQGDLDRLLWEGKVREAAAFPLWESWQALGLAPEGVGKDIFAAFQKLEGGLVSPEEIIMRSVKAALLACSSARIQGRLKQAAFGYTVPTYVDVNMGVLEKDRANVLLVGSFSPILKRKLLEAARDKKVKITGVCTDPLLPPMVIPPVTNYLSQEIPLLSGAVDLVVAGDQWVNPSLAEIALRHAVPVVYTQALGRETDLGAFAQAIVKKAEQAFAVREGMARQTSDERETAVLGFSEAQVPAGQIVAALKEGKIKGVAVISGSGNVKFTQDRTTLIMVQEFLKRDILCLSVGESSITLAKYGFLNPALREVQCGPGLYSFLSSLGRDVPAVIDFGRGENGVIIEFLIALAGVEGKPLSAYPLVACFPEANRGAEVVEALWYVAHGITTYFWPVLPVAGSPKTMTLLSQFLREKLGAELKISLEKRVEPQFKAAQIMKYLGVEGATIETKGGHVWKKN